MKIQQSLLHQTTLTLSAVTLGSLVLGTQQANAAAVIFSTGNAATASVALGVNNEGHLNVLDSTNTVVTSGDSSQNGYFGVAYKFPDGTWRDATSPGCLCEGWGVSGTLATSLTSHSGYANISSDGGVNNLTDLGFLSDAGSGTGTFATSNVRLTDIPLLVTQDYRVSTKTPNLFQNTVKITNTTGEDINDLRYVRVMDWDVPPTEFNEYVTIQGVGTTTFLERSHDNGFSTANPLVDDYPGVCGFECDPTTQDVDFTDSGSSDHGAYFRFNFGTLKAGETREFSIFYGAAESEAAANVAVAAEGLELFSYGQQAGDPTGGTPATYIFGFKGVGGTPVIPPKTPEPSGILGFLGLGALGLVSLKSKRKA
jgi:type IV pilus assembly protein PilY1